MMEVTPRKGSTITEIWREEDSLFLRQERGLIRLQPRTDDILRVSFTSEEKFPDVGVKSVVCRETDACDEVDTHDAQVKDNAAATDNGAESVTCSWDYVVDEDVLCLSMGNLKIKVSLLTGSIRYEKKDGTFLMSEREYESKETEAFEVWRTLDGQGAKIEEVQTPDGIKRRVKDAERVYDRTLFHTKLYMQFQQEEMLFGLGQSEDGIWDLRHTTQYLHQANQKIALPVLLSNMGYGIFLPTQSSVIFDDTGYESYLYTEAAAYLDYYFLAGDAVRIVKSVRLLTGKAVMLPFWAFGYMQSQERFESAAELVHTAERFRKTEFGIDTLVLDWMSWPDGQWGQKSFDKTRFPDPAGMIRALHDRDIHFMISIWPNMAAGYEDYLEFKEAGLLLPNSETYNVFREEGRKLYWKQVSEKLFCHGVDAWWCDSSEAVTPEWERQCKPTPAGLYHDFVEAAGNIMPIDQINAFGLYHAQGIYEGQRGETEEKRVVNLTRSGSLGIQKYGTILWSGDISASWETLRRQIAAGLQFCTCGLPYWTLDIGAFFVKKGPQWYWNGEYPDGIDNMGYRELYVRWFQYGAFLPIFRSHGTDVRREPWNYGEPGEPLYEALLAADRLRYRLMPYIYSLAGDVWRNDSIMMRPLFYDFPEDETAARISQQFMLGPALMVCPVTEPMFYGKNGEELTEVNRTKKIYLPDGTKWYDLYTESCYDGGQEISVPVCLERIPVFVRAGSIVPITAPANSTADMSGQDVEVLIYAGADGKFELYEDAGDGYGYEKGEYCVTEIVYTDADRNVNRKISGDETYRQGSISVRMIG